MGLHPNSILATQNDPPAARRRQSATSVPGAGADPRIQWAVGVPAGPRRQRNNRTHRSLFRRPTEAHGTLRSLVGSTWWRYNYGFDAQNDEYGNLLTKGIIDQVVRAALQGAASVAGLLITTEAMVAEVPRKQAAALAMPGGGMGGMDF